MSLPAGSDTGSQCATSSRSSTTVGGWAARSSTSDLFETLRKSKAGWTLPLPKQSGVHDFRSREHLPRDLKSRRFSRSRCRKDRPGPPPSLLGEDRA